MRTSVSEIMKQHWRDRSLDEHLSALLKQVASDQRSVAIGLDMAAAEGNWGLCVLLVDDSMESAELVLLLPSAAVRSSGEVAAKVRWLPSAKHLRMTLEELRKRGARASLAVDVPFGWPTEHATFTNAWSAVSRLPDGACLPSRVSFESRLCDREFRRAYQLTPFAVGADKIAQAAFAWCKTLTDLGALISWIDVGLDKADDPVARFETYPAAFVRNIAPAYADYKSVPQRRRELLKFLNESGYRLRVGAPSDSPDPIEEHPWCSWAIQQGGSPDAFDALLSALTAWDHLRARFGPSRPVLTTPENVLGRTVTNDDRVRIEREGWILVRAC